MRIIGFIAILLLFSCQSQGSKSYDLKAELGEKHLTAQGLDTATFAGGCFWCVEASFDQIRGVVEAVSGYSGGKKSTANYSSIGTGKTLLSMRQQARV